jgi:hypothetical protein
MPSKARQRGTAQVGGSPYTIRQKQTLCPLFSLTPEAQRKKLGKKEMPQKKFRLCGGDQRSARWIGAAF